jgi:hypothetical protein
MTHECAIVPDSGIPKRLPASTMDEESKPAM